jgi:dUTP pyrophosphatase
MNKIEELEQSINELKLQLYKYLNDDPVYFTYTDDEYGEMAKEWHKTNGIPFYVYEGDAGFDLPIMLSKEDQKHGSKIVWPGERELLHTGLRLQLPPGKYGRITHRSSTEKRYRLRIIEGIIDNAFRGAIFIQVHNMNDCKIDIYHGHRYAQLIICNIHKHKIEYKDKLSDTNRGQSGFGSTGI